MRYGFEGILANELHGVQARCSSFIPAGPGYEGVSPLNQVCAVAGSVAGQRYVDGDVYMKLVYDYSYDNLWKVRHSPKVYRLWLSDGVLEFGHRLCLSRRVLDSTVRVLGV